MPLNEEEGIEEEYEILESNQFLFQDDNKDSEYFKSLDCVKPIKELDLMINSLHTDLLINLYRCSMKLSYESGLLQ